MKVKRVRSVVKGLTWRILATITTFLLAFFVFREDPHIYEKAGLVALLELTFKLVLYYFHERVWIGVKWGVRESIE